VLTNFNQKFPGYSTASTLGSVEEDTLAADTAYFTYIMHA